MGSFDEKKVFWMLRWTIFEVLTNLCSLIRVQIVTSIFDVAIKSIWLGLVGKKSHLIMRRRLPLEVLRG